MLFSSKVSNSDIWLVTRTSSQISSYETLRLEEIHLVNSLAILFLSLSFWNCLFLRLASLEWNTQFKYASILSNVGKRRISSLVLPWKSEATKDCRHPNKANTNANNFMLFQSILWPLVIILSGTEALLCVIWIGYYCMSLNFMDFH